MKQTLIAIDQLINTLCGGWCDETLSARIYRNRDRSSWWKFLYKLTNALFFWQSDHCYLSYVQEMNRRHLPIAYRTRN